MNLGLLKELKTDEFRVALLPVQVKDLVKDGHTVFVEKNAGLYAGYNDIEYQHFGAKIHKKDDILSESEMILKIKAPLESEYTDYNKDHIIFTYFHFDENYLKPARVLIIGLGTIGLSALKYFLDNHLAVTILDKNIHTINDRINKRFNTHQIDYIENNSIICLPFNNDNPVESKTKLKEIIGSFDIIVNCAVRRSNLPKSKLKYLIDEEMIKKMEPTSVICDTTACDKNLIETCISSEKVDHIDIIHDVIHYNCDHIPSLVGRSASELLTSRTFPFIMDIANKGLVEAIRSNKPLYNGIVCYQGKITHQYIAQKKGFEFYELTDLI